nr:MAG TPA: hypothetical protein [Caudoviricetes sp.]
MGAPDWSVVISPSSFPGSSISSSDSILKSRIFLYPLSRYFLTLLLYSNLTCSAAVRCAFPLLTSIIG